MADREVMRALIEQTYADRGKGDINGVMAAFHADALFELVGEQKVLAIAGAVRGQTMVREAMASFIANFEFIERRIISIIADDDRAAVHSRLKIRFTPKDLTFSTEVVDLFKFKEGKILELVEFADTALIKDITA
jgi:ketosteroid isomerase-like protein